MLEQEENEMMNIPTINMVETGQNIVKLREKCGLSVKEIQDIFGFTTRRQSTNGAWNCTANRR